MSEELKSKNGDTLSELNRQKTESVQRLDALHIKRDLIWKTAEPVSSEIASEIENIKALTVRQNAWFEEVKTTFIPNDTTERMLLGDFSQNEI